MNDNVPVEENHPQKSTDELLADLNNPDPIRRVDVLNSLAGSGIKDQRILNELRLIAKGDPDPSVRDAARKAIRSLGIHNPANKKKDFWRGFLARYQQQIMGFVGWYLVSWPLVRPLGLNLFLLNIIALIVLALIKTTRRVAGGILIALALNFTISLILGLRLNALCFIPFFTPINSPF